MTSAVEGSAFDWSEAKADDPIGIEFGLSGKSKVFAAAVVATESKDDKAGKQIPPRQVVELPDNCQRIIEHHLNDKGQLVKVTRVVRIRKVRERVNRHVAQRRRWVKFGDAAGAPPGPEPGITMVDQRSTIDLSGLQLGALRDDEKSGAGSGLIAGGVRSSTSSGPEKLQDASSTFARGDGKSNFMSVVKCRNCGETGHWSRNCTSTPMTTVSATATSAATESSALMSGSSTGLYVAKHRRIGAGAGAASAGESARDDANTLRVQNLPSDTTKTDLGDLFGKFGRTTRIGGDGSRGFAFVTFVMRRDAELALTALHKFKYGNLVLSVEWAAVRKGT